MNYQLAILRRAVKELAQLPQKDKRRILTVLHVGHRKDVYR